jgi:hypothetical protein
MFLKPPRVLVLALCAMSAFAAFAGDSPESELKPAAVAVFKNGLAFMMRSGSVKLTAGEARLPFVPAATLGSLWVAPNNPGTSLEELVAYRYEDPKSETAVSIAELLEANPGKAVTVWYGQKEYTGEIVGLRSGEKKPANAGESETEAGVIPVAPATPQ